MWGSKFDSVRFEKRSEAKRERSEAKSEAKRKRSEAKAKAKRKAKRRAAKRLTKPASSAWADPGVPGGPGGPGGLPTEGGKAYQPTLWAFKNQRFSMPTQALPHTAPGTPQVPPRTPQVPPGPPPGTPTDPPGTPRDPPGNPRDPPRSPYLNTMDSKMLRKSRDGGRPWVGLWKPFYRS